MASIEQATIRGLTDTYSKVQDFMDSLFLNDYEKSVKERIAPVLREIEREAFRRVRTGKLIETPHAGKEGEGR